MSKLSNILYYTDAGRAILPLLSTDVTDPSGQRTNSAILFVTDVIGVMYTGTGLSTLSLADSYQQYKEAIYCYFAS